MEHRPICFRKTKHCGIFREEQKATQKKTTTTKKKKKKKIKKKKDKKRSCSFVRDQIKCGCIADER